MSKPVDLCGTMPDPFHDRLIKQHRHKQIIAPTPCPTPDLPPTLETHREQLTPASSTPRSLSPWEVRHPFEGLTRDPLDRHAAENRSWPAETPDLGTDTIAALLFSEIGKLCGRRPYLAYIVQVMEKAEIAVDVYLDEVTRYHILAPRDTPQTASPQAEDWWYVQNKLVRARSKLRQKDDIQRFLGLLEFEQAKGELDALKRVYLTAVRPVSVREAHSDGTSTASGDDSPRSFHLQSHRKPPQNATDSDLNERTQLPRKTITTHIARTAVPINLRLARSRDTLSKPNHVSAQHPT